MSLGCRLPAGVLVPGETQPTIALDGRRAAPDRAASGPPRIGRAAGQRAPLPWDLAARRAAATHARLQRREADAAATRVPARVRRPDHEAARRPARNRLPEPLPGLAAGGRLVPRAAQAVWPADPHRAIQRGRPETR